MAVSLVLRDRLPLLPSREARLLRVVLRPTRSAMSSLASVVSLGSPGSWTWAWSWPTAGEGWWSESARCRLGGGWLFPAGFLWEARGRADSGAVSPPSSPEASLDSAWTMGFWSMAMSFVVVVVVVVVLVRFRLELEDCEGESGEDMATGTGPGRRSGRARQAGSVVFVEVVACCVLLACRMDLGGSQLCGMLRLSVSQVAGVTGRSAVPQSGGTWWALGSFETDVRAGRLQRQPSF